MNSTICKWLLVASLVSLAGCGTPESECRDGVKDMKKRTESFVGSGQSDDIRTMMEQISSAETQLATGNFEGCLASLDQSRVLLKRSQRTNQQ